MTGARELGNPTALAITLFGFAMAWWQDEPEQARQAIEESQRLTEMGASDTVYADSLELLGRIQRAAGQIEDCLRTIRKSLRETIDVGNHLSVMSSQWYLAEALGLLDREPEFAAVMHGYTTFGPEASLMPTVGGTEADLHQEAIDGIRRAIGRKRFDQLVEQGGAMTYERAATYTLTELDRIISDAETEAAA